MQTTLDKYIENVPFKHIDTVLEAFELCENFDDVQKVIDNIPHKFGFFLAELLDDNYNTYNPEDPDTEELAPIITGFRITNLYTEFEDDTQTDIYDFEWYEGR